MNKDSKSKQSNSKKIIEYIKKNFRDDDYTINNDKGSTKTVIECYNPNIRRCIEEKFKNGYNFNDRKDKIVGHMDEKTRKSLDDIWGNAQLANLLNKNSIKNYNYIMSKVYTNGKLEYILHYDNKISVKGADGKPRQKKYLMQAVKVLNKGRGYIKNGVLVLNNPGKAQSKYRTVPVLSFDRKCLKPTTPKNAFVLIKAGKVVAFFSGNVFCIRMNSNHNSDEYEKENPVPSMTALVEDGGSKKNAHVVMELDGNEYLNKEYDSPSFDKKKKKVEGRRNRRHARRNRRKDEIIKNELDKCGYPKSLLNEHGLVDQSFEDAVEKIRQDQPSVALFFEDKYKSSKKPIESVRNDIKKCIMESYASMSRIIIRELKKQNVYNDINKEHIRNFYTKKQPRLKTLTNIKSIKKNINIRSVLHKFVKCNGFYASFSFSKAEDFDKYIENLYSLRNCFPKNPKGLYSLAKKYDSKLPKVLRNQKKKYWMGIYGWKVEYVPGIRDYVFIEDNDNFIGYVPYDLSKHFKKKGCGKTFYMNGITCFRESKNKKLYILKDVIDDLEEIYKKTLNNTKFNKKEINKINNKLSILNSCINTRYSFNLSSLSSLISDLRNIYNSLKKNYNNNPLHRKVKYFNKIHDDKNKQQRKQIRLPPSIKSRMDSRFSQIKHACMLFPITHYIPEEIKAVTKKGDKRHNTSFTPLEQGVEYLYNRIEKELGLTVVRGYFGRDTAKLRNKFSINKDFNKLSGKYSAHCSDAYVIANDFIRKNNKTLHKTSPGNKKIMYVKPNERKRRQLHKEVPQAGVERTKIREGGTVFKTTNGVFIRGDIVKHKKLGKLIVSGQEGNGNINLIKMNGDKSTPFRNRKPSDLTFIAHNNWFYPDFDRKV